MGNLPARTKVKQLMFNDNAFVSQKNLNEIPLTWKNLAKHTLRKKIFWNRLKFVDILIVQTNTELNRLKSFHKKLPNIHVLPPLFPIHLKDNSSIKFNLPKKNKNTIRLACIAYYWDHKNLEILADLLDLASKQHIPLQIIFTLNSMKIKGGKKLIHKLSPHIRSGYALNIGNLSPSKVASVIMQCDGVILPSLLETFGLNCLEAWHCQKVFFVADRPYAKEICQNAAVFFDPLDANDILAKIIGTFKNEPLQQKIIARGNTHIQKWHYNEAYISLIKENCKN
jgi:hypothetical protein